MVILNNTGWWRIIYDEYQKLRWWRVEYTPCNAPSTKINVVARSLWDIRNNPQEYLPNYNPRITYMRITSIKNPYVTEEPKPKQQPQPRPPDIGKRGPIPKAKIPYVSTNPTPSKNPNKAIPVAIIDGVGFYDWDQVAKEHYTTRGQYLRCVTDLGVGNVTHAALQRYLPVESTPIRSW